MLTILGLTGGWELIVVLGVILLLFGSAKLPKLARSLGSSVTEFKKGVKSGGDDADDAGGNVGEGDASEKINAPKDGSASKSESSSES
jgi:sec-independent protein translocase protein TatA